jgi:hypothetical protein
MDIFTFDLWVIAGFPFTSGRKMLRFELIHMFFISDFNEITPSKLLENNIKVKEKFCVVLVHSFHKELHLHTPY